MATHDLLDALEASWIRWRFADEHSALEGASAVLLSRLCAELDRRRRRQLLGRCTCAVCWDAITSG